MLVTIKLRRRVKHGAWKPLPYSTNFHAYFRIGTCFSELKAGTSYGVFRISIFSKGMQMAGDQVKNTAKFRITVIKYNE
jgi:hypothetical protein